MEAFYRGRVVLVVGGSSGMGLEAARALLKMGARVGLTARNPSRLKKAAAELSPFAPGHLHWRSVDAGNYRAMRRFALELAEKFGPIDLLLQCAGKARPGRAGDLPLRVYREQMNANFLTTVHSVRAVLPEMLERGSGHVGCIGSTAGELGIFGYTAYGPAKFAVRGFCEALRMELRPRGVRVSLVLPPDTDTPGFAGEQAHNPPELVALAGNAGLLSAESVARQILKGLARGRFRIVPGFQNRVIVRLAQFFPGLVRFVCDLIVARAARSETRPSSASAGRSGSRPKRQ